MARTEPRCTFDFLDAAPPQALETAREAAANQDGRIGGSPTVVHDFLAAGLVDQMHLVQVPIVVGRGVRIWDGLEALEDTNDIEAVFLPQLRHPPHIYAEGRLVKVATESQVVTGSVGLDAAERRNTRAMSRRGDLKPETKADSPAPRVTRGAGPRSGWSSAAARIARDPSCTHA